MTEVTLSSPTRIITVCLALFFAFITFEMIRRRKLQERYTVLWFIYSLLLCLVAIFPVLLSLLAQISGIADPNAALFALGFLGVAIMLLNLTVTVSRQHEQITRLAQEVALLRRQSEHR